MSENKCPSCGANIDVNVSECKYCGEVLVATQPQYQQQYQGNQQGEVPPQYGGGPQVQQPIEVVNSKNKVVAGLLGIFIGGLGIHKFYLGKIGQGILYILFCWTYIPVVIGFIEGIVYLASSDEKFHAKYDKKY